MQENIKEIVRPYGFICPAPVSPAKSWVLIDQKTKRKIPAQLIDSTTLVFIPKGKNTGRS